MDIRKQIENYIPMNEQEENDKKIILNRFLNMEDDILTRDNEIAHFTCSSWITNKTRDKILMIHHNIYNSWGWTGGHADGDSDFLHVALKEANEETGLTNFKVLSNEMISLEILTVDSHIKRGKFVSSHLHINVTFLLEANEEELLQIKEDENSNVAWFPCEETVNITSENKMRSIYTKLNNRLREYSK